jgi:uncharacterized protein (DUF305 family)
MIQPLMTRIAFVATGLLVAGAAAAEAQATPVSATEASIARARADSVRRPYTSADVDFMTGMVHHHAQAILMARWAPTHGASSMVQTLSARIINAQEDEIRIMQQWLADRRLPVPTPNPYGMEMDHGGARHEMLMPGMLSRVQLAALDSARGQMFDLLMLQNMVRHHEGAIGMVKQLFSTPGAGQDEIVFRLASDINADQTTEVARMRRMITALVIGGFD